MDRFTAGIVAGVLALVLLGLAVVVFGRGRSTSPDLSTPAGVALSFEDAVQRGDGEQAWELLAATARTSTTRDQFIQRVRRVDQRTRLVVNDERVDDDTARVELALLHPSTGGLFGDTGYGRVVVYLAREDGAWRVTTPGEPYLLSPRG
ncbi:MAG: hypothetical protein HY690_07165 [Chloroflexi bacterium]|nr:hypothetical protein [Chloroflexota bacterium]